MSALIVSNQITYDLVIDNTTVVHSGGELENCLDGNTYTSWQPNSGNSLINFTFDTTAMIVINEFALSGLENLPSDIVHINLWGSVSADFSDWIPLVGAYKPELDAGRRFYSEYDQQTPYRYYIVSIETETSALNKIKVGNILINGNSPIFPSGVSAPYTPPKLSAKTEILNNRTMGGNFVGRSVLSGQYDFIIKNKNITPEWIEENWLSLHKQISEKPFMYLWDDTRPQDAVFCWTKGDIPPPKYDNQCYFSFSIPCNGFIEND